MMAKKEAAEEAREQNPATVMTGAEKAVRQSLSGTVIAERPGRTQKSTAFTVLEWVIAVGCGIVMVLHTAGILTVGSAAADTAVNAGCTILSMLLILLAGKDSRN